MAEITLEAITKSFGLVEVIKGVDLRIADKEFVVFVGPSGCGKSTMLRLIAGLEEVTTGKVMIDGEDVTALSAPERGLSMVFQSYALYPHLTVRENMGFPLSVAGASKKEIKAAVDDAAAVLRLEPLLERKPKDLSGGQRQRVAIGRAIVRAPSAFLFDEPLSNLDAALRVQMRIEIARLRAKLDATMIYVTHDQVEAMTLADRIVVFSAGKIEQMGAPLELYRNPANIFVATFIGSPTMNILDCDPAADGAVMVGATTLSTERSVADGAVPSKLGIRPEDIALVEDGGADFTGTVAVAEHLGGDSFYYVEVPGVGEITVRAPGDHVAKTGETLHLTVRRDNIHLFDAHERCITRAP
ncbi:ABC transporter ATP-binding protein [Acuticoccus mangrovi]|uniref:Sn-glycerol-3-phosphate ABC transporter ATP-binding protein UgpC n=1 Tax=Acuticoccus mangrovi TaxID=2796142 RepID=A0A934IM37_9HYPH|nr:sn-glycerol-3-phosphate ABC transporter ATP-binding protein UgpC [Acuticoccus mangrovi]MBJ3775145.1 sn-glycerol-3-phosphate ABC transporter ATP-binding protein UgpC [Acuticoccus mangrovi]